MWIPYADIVRYRRMLRGLSRRNSLSNLRARTKDKIEDEDGKSLPSKRPSRTKRFSRSNSWPNDLSLLKTEPKLLKTIQDLSLFKTIEYWKTEFLGQSKSNPEPKPSKSNPEQ